MKNSQNLISIGVTLAVFAFSAIIVVITLYDFEIANFEPIFTDNDPYVIVKESHSFPRYEFGVPIEISSMTSHHYRISVWAIPDSIRLYDFGPCFIKEISITRAEPTVVYLQADGDEITLEPHFDLSFEDTLPYFSPKAMERTVLTSIGEMEFAIQAEDIQDTNNIKNWKIRADLIILTPGSLDFNAGDHCEKLGIN